MTTLGNVPTVWAGNPQWRILTNDQEKETNKSKDNKFYTNIKSRYMEGLFLMGQLEDCPLCHGSLFPLGGGAQVCENCEAFIEDGEITGTKEEED